MKYKVGDKVRIKSKEWYDKNKDENGEIKGNNLTFTKYFVIFCDLIMDIYLFEDNNYMLTISKNGHFEYAIMCCADWFEPVSDIASPMDSDNKLHINSCE